MERIHPFISRLVLPAFVLCLFLPVRPAQGQLGIGVIGGANFSSLSAMQANGALVSFDNATAFHAGVFLNLQLGPVGLRPSILYLNAGPLFEGATFLNQDDFDLAYVAIPVDITYTIGFGPLKPYLFAGPEFRVLNSTGAPLDLEENLQTFVMSANVGLGLALSLPGSSLRLYPQIRYSFGISELTDATYQVEGISIQTDGDSRVNMWLLSLGIGL